MDANERLFSYLFFKPKQVNGKDVPGKFEPLKVRFLYASVEQIPAGRVHLYNYAPKKFTRVLCLKNGKNKTEMDKHDCPLCKVERFGTPSNKYFAFVSDLNDGGALKLLELKWSVGKQLDEIAEIKGKPLHDMVFTISKKGEGKDTTYTPMFDEVSPFSVTDFFASLGISSYPTLVGPVNAKTPIMELSAQQMTDFVNGQYPWSSGEGATQSRKMTVLGSQVTVRNEQTSVAMPSPTTDIVDDLDEDAISYVDDTPKETSFF